MIVLTVVVYGLIFARNSNRYTSIFANLINNTSVNYTNCYYSKKIIEQNEEIGIPEGPNEFTEENVEEVLQSLNTYVEEHKNDYEVPLVNWIMGPEGYPILDLKY